jgi:hypothetical protein
MFVLITLSLELCFLPPPSALPIVYSFHRFVLFLPLLICHSCTRHSVSLLICIRELISIPTHVHVFTHISTQLSHINKHFIHWQDHDKWCVCLTSFICYLSTDAVIGRWTSCMPPRLSTKLWNATELTTLNTMEDDTRGLVDADLNNGSTNRCMCWLRSQATGQMCVSPSFLFSLY